MSDQAENIALTGQFFEWYVKASTDVVTLGDKIAGSTIPEPIKTCFLVIMAAQVKAFNDTLGAAACIKGMLEEVKEIKDDELGNWFKKEVGDAKRPETSP